MIEMFAQAAQNNIFVGIGVIIIVAAIFAIIARAFKQPLIPAYVLAGLILGPILHIITDQGVIKTLSEIGIAFLLFLVGLEIDLSKLKSVGIVASLGGITQAIILFSTGLILSLIFGLKSIEAVYLGIVIAFSSTMVVVKILSDKRELDTLHGRIIIGFLLMEDLMAIVILSILTNINDFSFSVLIVSLWKALLLIVIAIGANKYVFPKLFKFAASSQEMLFLSATSACFLFSLFFFSMDFSISIGAFVAGVTLANLPYTYEIIGRVKSMKDFFSTIFFVSLGISIVGISKGKIPILVALLCVVLFIKPFITFFIVSFFGYKTRTAYYTAIALPQVSEFALILVAQGMILGHISQEIFTITTIIAVSTMSFTPYFLKYENNIYEKVASWLKRFNKFSDTEALENTSDQKYDVLLVGYDRIGYSIVNKLHLMKKKLLIVDFNPEIIKKLIKEKMYCIYGDISDNEILERINLSKISMVISTSSEIRDNILLITKAKESNPKAIIFATAYKVEDALELYDCGADYVIVPHFLGGDHVSLLIEKFGDDIKKLVKHKLNHIQELKNRQGLGHDNMNISSHTHQVD